MTFNISLPAVVASLASDVLDSAKAAKTALNGSHDLYHFQMAVKEHGEPAVVRETTAVVQARSGCTYAEAAVIAGNRVQTALELVAGQDTFKTVRDNLNAEPQREMGPSQATA